MFYTIFFPKRRPKTDLKYDFKPRIREFTLTHKIGHLANCNFITYFTKTVIDTTLIVQLIVRCVVAS